MRLIDADALIEEFEQYLDRLNYERESISKSARISLIKWVIERTNDQPTAYDIDKVIEQLWELQEDVIQHGREVDRVGEVVEEAIEIVRKGGRND